MADKTMTVVMVEPGKPAYKTEIGTDLESLQKAVGGLIDIMRIDNKVNIVFNDEGKLINISKQRGIPRGIKYLLECYEIAHDDTPLPDVFVVNADCPERGQKIADEVSRINPDAVIHQLSIGPVIGAHTGPGFVALIHFGNRNAR